MKYLTFLLLFLATIALSACNRPSDLNDKGLLPNLFASDFALEISTNSTVTISKGSYIVNFEDACGMMKLISDGTIPTNASSDVPYWKLTLDNSLLNNGNMPIKIGPRQIVSRSNETQWTQEGIKFFAENITYNINPEYQLKPENGDSFGPFNIRVVFANDPRVGQWQVQSATTPSGPENGASTSTSDDEESSVVRAQAGLKPGLERCNQINTAFTNKISNIVKFSDGLVLNDLKSRGLGEAGPFKETVYIRDANELFLSKLNQNHNVSIQGAIEYCNQIKLGGLRWHLANFSEVQQALTNVNYVEGRWSTFSDSPLHSLWGRMSDPPDQGQQNIFVTDSIRLLDSTVQVEELGSREVVGSPFWLIQDENGKMNWATYGAFAPSATDIGGNRYSTASDVLNSSWAAPGYFRILCVTQYTT